VWQDDGRRQLVPGKLIGCARDGDSVAGGWGGSVERSVPMVGAQVANKNGDMPGL